MMFHLSADNSDGTTMSTTTPKFTPEPIDPSARIAFSVFGVIMVVGGALGNALLLTVIFQQFKRKSSFHILFVANLALADFLTLGYWWTFHVLDLILHRMPVVDDAHCVFNGVVIITLYFACILFLVSISLNRYLHVCHNHLYKRVFTLRRTVIWCGVVWLISFFLAILPVVDGLEETMYRYSPVTRFCSYHRGGTSYVKVLMLTFAILPMLFVGYCNAAIFLQWRRLRLSSLRRFPLQAKKKNACESERQKGAACRNEGRTSVAAVVTMDEKEARVRHDEDDDCDDTDSDAQESTEVGNEEDISADTTETPASLENSDRSSGGAEQRVLRMADGTRPGRGADDSYENERTSGYSLSSASQTSSSKAVADEIEEEPSTAEAEASRDAQTPVQKATDGLSLEAVCSGRDSHRISKVTGEDLEVGAALMSTATLKSATLTSTSGGPDSTDRSSRQTDQHGTAGKEVRGHKKDAFSGGKRRKAREVAFVRSLFVVFLLAVVTLIPYGLMTMMKSYFNMSAQWVIFGNFFLFLNNAVNWIVYGVMNPSFRQGYVQNVRRIFSLCCCLKGNDTRQQSHSSGVSLTTPSARKCYAVNDVTSSHASQIPTSTSQDDGRAGVVIVSRC